MPSRITDALCSPPLAKVSEVVSPKLLVGQCSSTLISKHVCLMRILDVAFPFLWLEVDKLGKRHGAVTSLA